MEKIFLGAIGLLTISLFIIVNGFDKCKNCGAPRGSNPVTYCRHCGEELIPKYPYARKIFFAIACVLIMLIFIYKRMYN